MAGHSKWSKIKHIKAVVDKKKGKEFSKVARMIMQAAREGGGDPSANLRLKYALEKARQVNMPKENVERAIKKGVGDVDGVVFDETTYEGYGPGGVAILVDVLTDNRNRTVGEVRKAFDRRGGNLGTSGCVSWMFTKQGIVTIESDKIAEDDLIDLALEAGAENVELEGDLFSVTVAPESYDALLEAVAAASIEPESSELTMVPQNTVPLDRENAEKVLNLLSDLDDLDDVQEVHSNADIPEDAVAAG